MAYKHLGELCENTLPQLPCLLCAWPCSCCLRVDITALNPNFDRSYMSPDFQKGTLRLRDVKSPSWPVMEAPLSLQQWDCPFHPYQFPDRRFIEAISCLPHRLSHASGSWFFFGGGGLWQRGVRKWPAEIQNRVDKIINVMVNRAERLLCAKHTAEPSPAGVLSSLKGRGSTLGFVQSV